jgi:2,5-diketo-D-gluconate reductase A
VATVPTIRLNNGVEPEDTADAVATALEIGYRHIDTAEMYGNEKGVGEAVARAGLDRGEVFVTSKLNNGFHRRDDALRAFDQSLADLGFEYLDLFLIHWPLPGIDVDYIETWKAMEEIYASGRCRAIGVSNFQAHHLRRLFSQAEVRPAVNQIEVHPYLTQEELRAFDADHEVVTEAWSPIAQGKVLGDPVVQRVAERYSRTPAQVVLRWHVQRGDVVFPKSVSRERMQENFALFDFELDGDAMGDLTALDRGERTGPDPDTFNYIPG